MKEEDKIKTLPWFGFVRLWPYVKQYRNKLAFAVVLGLLASLIDACWPLFNQYALNHYVAENTLDTIWLFVILYVVLLVTQVVINFISTYRCSQIEMGINQDLRNASFNHLQTLSFSYFNQNNVGYVHARVMSDTGKIGEMVSWRLMDLVWNGSYLLFVVIGSLVRLWC